MTQPIPSPRHGIPGYYALADLPQRTALSEAVRTTGWPQLDLIFKIYPGQFVVVTGNPGSGKSTFLFNLIVKLCHEHGAKAWLYAPENELNLFQKIKRIFGDTGEGPLFGQFANTRCFVRSSDYVHYSDEPRDIEWILSNAYAAYQKDGISIAMIDPWNEIERARHRDENLTDYIGRCLMRVKMFSKLTGVTVFMVAHPTKAANGRAVTLADIEGSMHWFNKCDNGLIVSHIAGSPETTVISAKVREQPFAGRIGHCVFVVDGETGVFNEMPNGAKVL